MVSIITGDIIESRKHTVPDRWIKPLKELLSEMGRETLDWNIYRGDSFQLRITHPLESFKSALIVKTFLYANSQTSVRMAIGIGPGEGSGHIVSESFGPAYQSSGLLLDSLKVAKSDLAITSPWEEFNKEWKLLTQLSGIIIDSWSVAAHEIVYTCLKHPDWSQESLADHLKISQASVSGRLKRAHFKEISDIESWFRYKLQKHLDQ